MAAYAAIYGVTYAYVLHHIVNVIFAWLMVVYYANGRESGFKGVARLLENKESVDAKGGARGVESKDGRSELKGGNGRRMDDNGKMEAKVP